MRHENVDKRAPPLPSVVARALEIGSNEKTEGVSPEYALNYVLQKVLPEMFTAITDRIIPQGAAELSQALFTHSAYAPYGPALRPLAPDEYGVHGPEPTLEEKAAELVALEEAKANARKQRQIDKEVADMSPEEQRIAQAFRSAPTPRVPDLDMER